MRQRHFLRLAHVIEERARRSDGERRAGAAEPGEVARPELLGERTRGGFGVEMPRGPRPPRPRRGGALGQGPGAVGHQKLRGTQPFQLGLQCIGRYHLHDREAAGGQVEPRQAEAAARAADAREHVVAPFLEQCLVGDGAGGHDAHHLALHGPLVLAGIAALFAYGDRLAFADQPSEIGIEGDGGNARHGNRRSRRCAPLGQRDVQELRRAPCILVEHLVEVAHPVEQQDVGVLRLDAQILLHHGCVVGQGSRLIDAHRGRFGVHALHSPHLACDPHALCRARARLTGEAILAIKNSGARREGR